MKSRGLVFVCAMLVLGCALPSFSLDDPKTYTVNKVKGTAPVIDGQFTEEEWAGSAWTGEFYGLDNDANTTGRAEKVDLNYRLRMLYDDEYLYFLFQGDMGYLNGNGNVYEADDVNPLESDDAGYADWATGQCVDFEIFLEPDWLEGDAANDQASASPAYQLCYFPLKEYVDDTGAVLYPSNFGVRGAEGPPYFFTGLTGDAAKRPFGTVDWAPISDAQAAAAKNVKPLLFAALPHEVPGAKVGTDVVAKPVIEIAFPFSQFSVVPLIDADYPDTPVVRDDVPEEGRNLFMEKDADGKWVKAGDQWLFNMCGYTDNIVALTGLTLITWNDMEPGGFHNYPHGILTFAAPTPVDSWSLY